MSTPVIQVTDLSKRYRLGASLNHDTLRDHLTYSFKSLWHRLRGNGHFNRDDRPVMSSRFLSSSSGADSEFWALKGVSFEVRQGEIVGIIGRNGAGKSTLLKILSRITEPTEGEVRMRGRVASLLEVGTGFHPELSGRENIYLNGAILGMSRAEIKAKFDEIVAFAEIDKFIDTPVKRYSSGMYVRLAFAVAAHLEPEILLVDEVLAVGDAAFQKKCLGKMGDVAKEGRTVLLVSHNMGVIREIAGRGIWLNEGKVLFYGDIKDVVLRYLSFGQSLNDTEVDLSNHPNRLKKMKRLLRKACCKKSSGELSRDFSQDEKITLEIDYCAPDGVRLAGAGFNISTVEGIRVGGFNTYMAYPPPHKLPQKGSVTFGILARQFTPGTYLVSISLGSHYGSLEDKIENAISFTVHQADIYGTGYLLTKEDGVVALSAKAFIAPLGILN